MKILVYGINYSPELTGIGKYTGEMCEWLVSQGHEVEVITSMPYYPQWEIQEGYKNKWWHAEFIKGVKVLRSPLYVPRKVTGISRILHELSFVISSSYFWFPRFFKKYDVVIGICPPLQTGFFPLLYKKLRRKPFIFHVQDLQVDMARELGLIKNYFLFRFLAKLERFLLKRATLVSTISMGMKRRIQGKILKPEQIIFLPNWVDTDFIKPLSNVPLKTELGFNEKDKIILYSGNMGEKQGLEVILSIAEKLSEEPSLQFVFSGAGVSKAKLQNSVKKKGLKNVRFIDVQPYEKLDQLLNLADIHLVLQKKVASDLVFPSKLLSILSVGACAIVTASPDTDLYDLMVKNKIGVVIEPENEEALMKAIVSSLQADTSILKKNARKYAVEELTKEKILHNFENTLQSFNRNLN